MQGPQEGCRAEAAGDEASRYGLHEVSGDRRKTLQLSLVQGEVRTLICVRERKEEARNQLDDVSDVQSSTPIVEG